MKTLTYLKKLHPTAEANIIAEMLAALRQSPTPLLWHEWAQKVEMPDLMEPSPPTRNGECVPIYQWSATNGDRPLGTGSVFLAIVDKLLDENKVERQWDDHVLAYRYFTRVHAAAYRRCPASSGTGYIKRSLTMTHDLQEYVLWHIEDRMREFDDEMQWDLEETDPTYCKAEYEPVPHSVEWAGGKLSGYWGWSPFAGTLVPYRSERWSFTTAEFEINSVGGLVCGDWADVVSHFLAEPNSVGSAGPLLSDHAEIQRMISNSADQDLGSTEAVRLTLVLAEGA